MKYSSLNSPFDRTSQFNRPLPFDKPLPFERTSSFDKPFLKSSELPLFDYKEKRNKIWEEEDWRRGFNDGKMGKPLVDATSFSPKGRGYAAANGDLVCQRHFQEDQDRLNRQREEEARVRAMEDRRREKERRQGDLDFQMRQRDQVQLDFKPGYRTGIFDVDQTITRIETRAALHQELKLDLARDGLNPQDAKYLLPFDRMPSPPISRGPSFDGNLPAPRSSLNPSYEPPKIKPTFSFEEEQRQRVMQERSYDSQNGKLCGEFGISGMPLSRDSAPEFREGEIVGQIVRLEKAERHSSFMENMGDPNSLYTRDHTLEIGRQLAEKKDLLKSTQDFHKQQRELNDHKNRQLGGLGL